MVGTYNNETDIKFKSPDIKAQTLPKILQHPYSLFYLPDGLGVVPEGTMSLLLELSLFILLLLLLLDNAEELITLGLGLLGQHHLTLNELLPSGNVEILGLFTLQLSLLFLLSAGLALTFLEGAFGTKGIDLTLTVSGALLELTQALDLQLFFFFDASGLGCRSLFLSDAIGVVTDDF